MVKAEVINKNLRKLARLKKLINSADNPPEFEGLLRRYETIYDVTSTLMNREMDRRGYLLMVCVNGDKVAFVREGKEHLVPEGYIVYTDEEIRLLQRIRLVHEVKKLTQARVTEVKVRCSNAMPPCYKDVGLCCLAENQPLSSCIYKPDSCWWRVHPWEAYWDIKE